MEMTAKIKVTPKDFFLYVAAMASLYVSVVSFLMLVFQCINVLFPDQLERSYDPYSSSIRFAIASLVIVFPLYIFLVKMLNRELRAAPEKKELWVRRWLVYLTLFVGGITIVVDLIVLINTFLGGDLTTRFVLKVFSVLVVVGSGFGYYFYDLKGKWEREPKTAGTVGWVALAVVLATVIGGFFIIGTPQTQRMYRFDEQKVGDLLNIQYQVVNYWQSKEKLPAAISDLEDPLTGFVAPKDPQTGESYAYEQTGELSFKLCATFNRASRFIEQTAAVKPAPVYPGSPEDANWQHGQGETCFERTVDPERFPPFKKTERPVSLTPRI